MTDLEMTKRCAEAEGRTVSDRPAHQVVAFKVSDSAVIASNDKGGSDVYDPLHNDEQAMGLVKHLRLHINDMQDGNTRAWGVLPGSRGGLGAYSRDLNRAIVQCVVKMRAPHG